MVHTRSTRDASPTPTNNSDHYYSDDPVFYDEDEYVQSLRSADSDRDFTPTPTPARSTSPASVVELTPEDFPALAAPAKEEKARRKPAAKKGKKCATTAELTANEEPDAGADEAKVNDPHLAADLALATATSLGLPTVLNYATKGASSSRRPAPAAGSPSKRARANTAGDTALSSSTAETRTQPSSVTTPTHAQDGASPFLAPVTIAAAVPPPAGASRTPPLETLLPSLQLPPPPLPSLVLLRMLLWLRPWPQAWLWQLAQFGRQRTEIPPRLLHPNPPGGYGDIIYSPTRLWLGVPPDLRAQYGTVADPKFFLMVSGGNGQAMRTHAIIRNAIGSYININSHDFQLGTPPAVENGPSPALWLVAGIPAHLAQAILAKRVLSSTRITIFPIPFDMPVNGFIGMYGGLTLPDTAGELPWHSASFRMLPEQTARSHKQAFDTFIISMRVHALRLTINDVKTVTWQLHVTSPTRNHTAWNQLCHLFRHINIMTALHGTVYLLRPFHCHICLSVAHPTDLCPLPAVPGWLGLTPTTIKALEDASRQATIKAREHMHANAAPVAERPNPRSNPAAAKALRMATGSHARMGRGRGVTIIRQRQASRA
ncbi:hypothetical protein B0H13DRAFT_2365166 [Mycena leptocephala]|nr:hypothetical protein B0H13DRAFT_2365166 [Mycena leptocephala]